MMALYLQRIILTLYLCAACFLLPAGVQAWPGYDWSLWHETTHAVKPEISSLQAGLADLLPLLCSDGIDSASIDSIQGWEKKRDRILAVIQTMMGEAEDIEPLPPLQEILKDEDQGTYIRRHLRIRSEPDDWIPAYLLIPKNLPHQPVPVMIVLHQTVAQGKDEPAGIRGSSELAFGVELVQRGYICLLPDAIGFGERIPPDTQPYHDALEFYMKHPRWSFFGKMVWDIHRLVDYLVTLPEVDPYRIGCIGHSHGAYGTLTAAMFEPRISAAVASCGFTTLRRDPVPERWSHLTALMPAIGFYLENIASIPFDWHEILATLAPRPLFYWGTLEDKIFPNTENLLGIAEELRGVYGLYGAADWLSFHLVPGDHSFPPHAREMAYQWLDRVLSPRPSQPFFSADALPSQTEWQKRRVEIERLLQRDLGSVDPPDMDIRVELIAVEKRDGYIEKKIRYEVAPGESISAYLLTPEKSSAPRPGVIVFHQTTEVGKEEAVGHAGRASLHFGPELARRGYVVLAPDSICAGDRITASGSFDTRDFYRRSPSASAMGKMIQDGRRAVDVLQVLPGVLPGRIGVIGHSLGAEEALFTAAFDERITAAVASCGFAPLRAEPQLDRWARDHWFSYLPRWRVDLRAGRRPAWDFDAVMQLIAPRGFFNCQTTEDEIFPEGEAVESMIESIRPLWHSFGADDRLQCHIEAGPHDITASAKQAVYSWMDSLLQSRN